MKMKRAGKQQATAVVLGMRFLDSQKVAIELQVMGGGVETCWRTQEQVEALGLEVGAAIEVDVVFRKHGEVEIPREKNGKTYRDSYSTYLMKVYLPRSEDEAASRQQPSRKSAA